MMVPLTSGERALRELEKDMPWIGDRALPQPDVGVFAVKGSVFAASLGVYDDANKRMRELDIPVELAGAIAADPTGDAIERVKVSLPRVLCAPWC